ncbi:MAG: N-acetylglucosamine-6-phosphate deacetylase, partial [Beijerinckiaceae bacterium]
GAAPGLPAIALPEDAILAPGFIDVQVNGGGGLLLNDDPSVGTIRAIAAAHRAFGTTGLLPTLITDAPEKLRQLAAAAPAAMAVPGVLGFHLEGPFLNPARKGIHPEQHIRPMMAEDEGLLVGLAAHGRSIVTLAPERMAAGRIRALAAAGMRVSLGHSDATAAEAAQAVAEGATGVTHLFNAMSQIAPRQPGLTGAALATDDLFAGIICDGHHVDADNLRIAFRAKGRDRLMLVTDAMPLVGTASDGFSLHGRPISLRDGRLQDAAGTLAGAHLTMFDAVRNAMRLMRLGIEDALIMASRTPAVFLGLDADLGAIRPGYRADLVAFTADKVIRTWIGGAGMVH